MTIQGAEFINNVAFRNGGALKFVDSTPSGRIGMQDVTIMNNIAVRGGGVFLDSASQFDMRAPTTPNRVMLNRAMTGGALYMVLKSTQKNAVQVRLWR